MKVVCKGDKFCNFLNEMSRAIANNILPAKKCS